MTPIKAIVSAAFAATSIIITTGASFATDAQATTALNVRSGPGTSYGVVDTLTPGERVEVNECATNGWCYIEHTGPDGWVSSNYLSPVSGGSAEPDCGFSFTITPSGPSLSISCGDTPTPTPTPPAGNVACFYTGTNYTGSEFCHGPATLNTLDATFNDNIASVKLYGSAKAKLCRNANLTGTCKTYTTSKSVLPITIRNKASSVRIFTGVIPLPPVTPVTHSTGPINLQQTYTANLDNGAIGGGGADIWYRAVTAVQKYIKPINGAKLAVGNKSNRGYSGCKVASYSSAQVSIWTLPVGSYVCVKTSQGRISQFRLNGYSGTTMKLGYTTWAN
ncbi:SH3 domain-containing protein [Maritalea porphyrae]|jgi:hypothetical protein|uniref:SH3 domain-containing protein n=1 Tax=Maritalea porphyrae TaxID=880732 RepID=UPI0022B0253A|nr:SH3 domain-containing protein [Maritalea porphyrae]MCZ4271481.1 SH3 domain-containing protein [Maritalea porphyrae]